MEEKKSDRDHHPSQVNKTKKTDENRGYTSRASVTANDLWTDGLICAFEFIRGHKRSNILSSSTKVPNRLQFSKVQHPANGPSWESPQKLHTKSLDIPPQSESLGYHGATHDDKRDSQVHQLGQPRTVERLEGSYWIPIGWARISELVQNVQVDAVWSSEQLESIDDDDITVADLAAPYWERPGGPVWWCHLSSGHPNVEAWLIGAQWLHPAISLALRDESRLISEKMKHLLYEVNFLLLSSFILFTYCFALIWL